jgi:pyruvate-formate lyase-activating enzyme
MSGGFTLSGGEPLMQDRFAVKLFTAAKMMGIHTALDTNGTLGNRLSEAELEQIDLVLLDIKTWDAERHRHLNRDGQWRYSGFCTAAGQPQKIHMGTLRAGPWTDRRY